MAMTKALAMATVMDIIGVVVEFIVAVVAVAAAVAVDVVIGEGSVTMATVQRADCV